MIEASLLVGPQSRQRRGSIHMRGRAIGLKGIDTNFGGRMQIIPGFGVERRHVARRAFPFRSEDALPSADSVFIEAACWRRWSRNGQLVEMKGGQLWGDAVRHSTHIA